MNSGTLFYLKVFKVQTRKSNHQRLALRLMTCHREAEHYLCIGDYVFLIGGLRYS